MVREAAGHLCRNVKSSSSILLKPKNIYFEEKYLNFARFSVQSIAYDNALFLKYNRRLKSHSTSEHTFHLMKECFERARAMEASLRGTVYELVGAAKETKGVMASLEQIVSNLSSSESGLQEEKVKLQENHDFGSLQSGAPTLASIREPQGSYAEAFQTDLTIRTTGVDANLRKA
ncbi:PREDICTED: uncharacterized protein LOC104712454 [Camelina sativa]|uniref:Uncharacterized protein LOC104712454 n=1 Tax=Camelina sativa TaxID=90675 RepID=A0ABM0TKB1_CAMSA|nr:PREDICTED: uncharacterized protein LOC104712454 [Camelina sativa]